MTIIAVDPGPHLGIAIHSIKCSRVGGCLHDNVGPEVECCCDTKNCDLPMLDEYLMVMVTEPVKLWNIIQTHKPSVIVLENFSSSGPISRDGQSTIRLVGACELAAYITGASLVLQSPQERYSQMDNARSMLKAIGRKLVSHEVDSLAHLLLYEWRVANNINIRRRTFETTTV